MKPPTEELSPKPIAALSQIQMIPHRQIVRSTLNPRTTFDPGKHAELCLSMKTHGFFPDQPLLVRPRNEVRIEPNEGGPTTIYVRLVGEEKWNHFAEAENDDAAWAIARGAQIFELVKGECRWRAAGDSAIVDLPCVIRAMSDQEALEQALIENLQRTDLSPMEEAMGYQRLDEMLHAEHPDWEDKQRYEVIRHKIGRGTEMHVRQRLALCRLRGEAAGIAVESGRLSASHGELIARLPSRELRAEVTKKVLSPAFGEDGCMTRAQLRMLMLDYQRELRGASFDPKCATLVPVIEDPDNGQRVAGGACTDCRHNTKNQAADAEAKGTKFHACLNTACFEQKEAAAYEQWRALVTNGETSALPREENAQLWDHTGKALAHHCGYVELSDMPAAFELKAEVKLDPVKGKWLSLVKGRDVPIVLARDDTGKVHDVVKHDLAVTAAIENKHDIFKEAPKGEHTPAESAVDAAADSMLNEQTKEAARVAAEEAEIERERVWDAEVGAVAAAVELQPEPEGFWQLLYEMLTTHLPDGRSLAEARRGLTEEAFEKSIATGSPGYARAAFLEVLVQQHFWSENDPALLKPLAKLYKADVKTAAKSAREALKLERAAAAELAEIAAGMEWKVRKDKKSDGEFTFSSNNVAENPDRCELHFPTAAKLTASVSVAWVARNQWVVGWFVQGPKFGTSEPCSAIGTKYSSRELAMRTGLLGIADQCKTHAAHEAAQSRLAAWLARIEAPTAKKKGGAQ
jgi:ParB/RepB/Spo0J family partition protein